MVIKKAVVGALAAALAFPPAALAKSRKELEEESRQKAADAKHQQELSQAQGTHEKGTPSPLSERQRKEIGDVWARNQLAEQAGRLAMQKGKSAEVKNMGRWVADDHRRVSQDLGKLLQDRGQNPATLPPAQDRERITAELGAVAKASDDEFDRQFVEFLTRNTPTFAQAFGRARDATPGSDADLKWYLDQGERLENGHRDAARQLSSQRQARTPPPGPPRPAPVRPTGQ